MASNCTLGIQNLVKTTLNNKPWFEYDQSLGIVNILDSFAKKINKENSHGVAKTTAITINKQINDGYKNIGDIAFVKSNKEGRGYIDIAPTINQIYLINAQNEKEINELQQQLDEEELLKGFYQTRETGNYDVVDGEIVPFFGNEANLNVLNNFQEEQKELDKIVTKINNESRQLDLFESFQNIITNENKPTPIDTTKSDGLLWGEMSSYESETNFQPTKSKSQYRPDNSLQERINGRDFKEIWNSNEFTQLERENILLHSIQERMLDKTTFNGELFAGINSKLGKLELRVVDNEKYPFLAFQKQIYINPKTFLKYLQNANIEDVDKYLDLTVSEELIHVLTNYFTSLEDIKKIATEINPNNFKYIQSIYKSLPSGDFELGTREYLRMIVQQEIQGFKDFVQGKQFQKLTAEEKAKTIEQVTKEQDNSLFGLNTQNQEQLEFHVNTLNVVSKFLENVGVEQRLVSEFLSQDGSIVDGALAATNFIEGTVDIIDDLNKGRAEAWNKLPEEAAHWWYRLLNENSPLKKALWESHQTALKNDELYAGQYGKLVKSPSDLTEESIGQLIAEAIKRIETKNGNASDYSFFKKLLEWINSIIDIFKNTTQDPFEVAAMKILSSDMSDLMTWEEYRKLNNIVNFADILTEQSVAPIDYTLIEDIGFIGSTFMEDAEGNAKSGYRFHFRDSDWIKKYGDSSPSFYTQEELDNWVSANVKEYDQRQKQILQEVRDNQIFFDRLLNKTFRKKSKFLPKTLRKYFDIIDAQNLNQLREWNISQELQQITKKLSDFEKKQIIETNGYTNIAPTLKVLPDLLQKYRKNPIVLSEPIKIDGAKKQELSILNGIREMIKLENPNLKSITAEEFVNEAHNWLQTNYLLGFANENKWLSYNVDQTFVHVKDRVSNEANPLANMTEEEINNLPFEERQRIANIVGLTKQNPDVYHNKVSLRFNDMYHLKSGHFDKSPSAWGNLTYFYTGKNKWKDAVLLHEIQNDNIEFLREFKEEKIDLEASLGRYLQQLNTNLLDNITQIESGGKKIIKNNVWSTNPPKQHLQLNYQLEQLKNLPLEQGLSQLKQNLNEQIELYKSDNSVRTNVEKAQEAVEKAYSQRRIFRDFQKRGGIKSLLTKEEVQDLENLLKRLNTEEVETATWSADDNAYFSDLGIRDLKQKKKDFSNEVIAIQTKINNKLSDTYGDNAPLINLTAPAKPRTKNQIRQGVQRSQELNENVNWLLAYSEKKILDGLSKTIEESKKNYIIARNATNGYNFNVSLSKITPEQYATLIENYKYNEDLLNRLIDEQAQKDFRKESIDISKLTDEEILKDIKGEFEEPNEIDGTAGSGFRYKNMYLSQNANTKEKAIQEIRDRYNPSKQIEKEKQRFESLKQQALDKKAELEKNYGKIEEEVKQTLEVEMNYFTPLVHHLIQKHISQYGKEVPMYFSGYQITKLTQGNDRTAMIYAGKDEVNIVNKTSFDIENDKYSYITLNTLDYRKNGNVISQQEYEKAYQQATERRAKEIKFEAAKQIGFLSNEHNGTNLSDLTDKELDEGIKELNQYKRQSRQNLDRVINTIMNISGNKPIETGAIYNAMSQISGVKLIWQDKIKGLKGAVGGYLVDLTNYNYNTPILYGLNTSKVGSKQDIEKFKEFISNNTQKTEDYFSNEINKIQKESKVIENSLKEYETSKKIDNRNTTKAIKNKEEKTKETNNKLLSLGFEFINENEYQFSTSSYITFKSKLNSLEGIDVSINTFKSPDYLIKIKIAPLKNNFDLQKQGELPFNPIELKLALKENDFIQDIADNTFEGLTEEQINILRDNLENGELNLNCKI